MSDTQAKATPPHEAIGRLPLYACAHWTGYGIESELCQNYLHVLSALKGLTRLFSNDSPFYIKKLGAGITNADQERIDKLFIAAEAAIQSAEGPGSKAVLAVRARWERLGLDPATAPTVFASDVENMVEEELRGLRDNAGRAAIQYDDPAL